MVVMFKIRESNKNVFCLKTFKMNDLNDIKKHLFKIIFFFLLIEQYLIFYLCADCEFTIFKTYENVLFNVVVVKIYN